MNKTRLLDVKIVRELIASLQEHYAKHTDIVLNLAVSVLVIAFISYQALTLLTRPNRYDRPPKLEPDKLKKPTCDKGTGDDALFTDLHEHLYKGNEIPYHLPVFDDDETLKHSQYFYEQMRMRRSVRTFSDRPVSLKIIQNLIKTAGTAPSVGNAQPWIFCVIVRDDLKQMIRQLLEESERENYTTRAGAEWVVDVSQLQSTWSRPYITDAPYVLAVCHEVFKDVGGKKERLFHYNQMSAAIAVGMLLAAIQNVGLATVVTSPLNAGPQISKLLRRPDSECLMTLLPLGYPGYDATVPDIKRKPIENITKLY